MGTGRGKFQAIPSPGTGAQRGQREKAWVKIQKEQKVQKVKSHIWQKWKSESEKVNVVNGELGESAESVNVNAKWILIIRIKNPYNNVRA